MYFTSDLYCITRIEDEDANYLFLITNYFFSFLSERVKINSQLKNAPTAHELLLTHRKCELVV